MPESPSGSVGAAGRDGWGVTDATYKSNTSAGSSPKQERDPFDVGPGGQVAAEFELPPANDDVLQFETVSPPERYPFVLGATQKVYLAVPPRHATPRIPDALTEKSAYQTDPRFGVPAPPSPRTKARRRVKTYMRAMEVQETRRKTGLSGDMLAAGGGDAVRRAHSKKAKGRGVGRHRIRMPKPLKDDEGNEVDSFALAATFMGPDLIEQWKAEAEEGEKLGLDVMQPYNTRDAKRRQIEAEKTAKALALTAAGSTATPGLGATQTATGRVRASAASPAEASSRPSPVRGAGLSLYATDRSGPVLPEPETSPFVPTLADIARVEAAERAGMRDTQSSLASTSIEGQQAPLASTMGGEFSEAFHSLAAEGKPLSKSLGLDFNVLFSDSAQQGDGPGLNDSLMTDYGEDAAPPGSPERTTHRRPAQPATGASDTGVPITFEDGWDSPSTAGGTARRSSPPRSGMRLSPTLRSSTRRRRSDTEADEPELKVHTLARSSPLRSSVNPKPPESGSVSQKPANEDGIYRAALPMRDGARTPKRRRRTLSPLHKTKAAANKRGGSASSPHRSGPDFYLIDRAAAPSRLPPALQSFWERNPQLLPKGALAPSNPRNAASSFTGTTAGGRGANKMVPPPGPAGGAVEAPGQVVGGEGSAVRSYLDDAKRRPATDKGELRARRKAAETARFGERFEMGLESFDVTDGSKYRTPGDVERGMRAATASAAVRGLEPAVMTGFASVEIVGISSEMQRKIDAAVVPPDEKDMWHDEYNSEIARPLDSTVFVDREAQLQVPGTAKMYNPPRDADPDPDTSEFTYGTVAHEAATRIQRAWYRFGDRKDRAARLLQAAVRGHHTRRPFRLLSALSTAAATKMQSLVRMRLGFLRAKRRWEELQFATVVLIQKRYRGILGRRYAARVRFERDTRMATRIQAMARGVHGRKHAWNLKFMRDLWWSERRLRAVLILNRMARGFIHRQRAKLRMYHRNRIYRWWWRMQDEKRQAAINVQRTYRGYIARHHFKSGMATRVQTGVRGMLARAAVARLKVDLLAAEAERWAEEEKVVEAAGDVSVDETIAFIKTKTGKKRVKLEKQAVKAARKLAKAERALMTPKQRTIEEVRDTFEIFDADGSGAIDIDELRLLMKELAVPMTEEELVAAMKVMDIDGGGDVDFAEFLFWFDGTPKAEVQALDEYKSQRRAMRLAEVEQQRAEGTPPKEEKPKGRIGKLMRMPSRAGGEGGSSRRLLRGMSSFRIGSRAKAAPVAAEADNATGGAGGAGEAEATPTSGVVSPQTPTGAREGTPAAAAAAAVDTPSTVRKKKHQSAKEAAIAALPFRARGIPWKIKTPADSDDEDDGADEHKGDEGDKRSTKKKKKKKGKKAEPPGPPKPEGAKMALAKLKLKGIKAIKDAMGITTTKLAERNIIIKRRDDACRSARMRFRKDRPPKYACPHCVRGFPFESAIVEHLLEGCEPDDIRP